MSGFSQKMEPECKTEYFSEYLSTEKVTYGAPRLCFSFFFIQIGVDLSIYYLYNICILNLGQFSQTLILINRLDHQLTNR